MAGWAHRKERPAEFALVFLAVPVLVATSSGSPATAGEDQVAAAYHSCGAPTGCSELVFAGTDRRDRIKARASRDRSRWTAEAKRGIEALRGCEQIDPGSVRCRRPGGFAVAFFGVGGDDLIRVNAAVRTNFLLGGTGNDKLIGGHRRDLVLGGQDGADVIRGRSGRDSYFGGGGRDELRAADDDRDARIDCGRGRDVAYVDRQDPKPIDCERVVVRHAR